MNLDDDYIEEEDIEDLILDSDYSKCFESTNRKQLELIENHSLNLDINYKEILEKYKKYFTEKRYELICNLL
ncbi:MAG: HipA family kinase, partial [Sarcina sp.]